LTVGWNDIRQPDNRTDGQDEGGMPSKSAPPCSYYFLPGIHLRDIGRDLVQIGDFLLSRAYYTNVD